MGNKDDWPREKRWKDLYLRSAKLARAKQLGFDYPRTTEKQLVQEEELARTDERLKVLFVCSRNQWRSPTAEQIWRKHPQLLVRSGGTSPNARHKVSVEDIRPKRATIARSSSISTSGGSLRTPRASWSKPTPRPASTKARSTPQIHRSLKTTHASAALLGTRGSSPGATLALLPLEPAAPVVVGAATDR